MDFNGARRAGEFNQGDIIGQLSPILREKSGGKITERQIAVISDGFCYALSLEWLRLATEHTGTGSPGMSLILEGQNLLSLRDANACAYFVQIANNFVTYWESFETLGRLLAPEDFLSALHTFSDWQEIDAFFLTTGTKDAIQPRGAAAHSASTLPALLNDTGIHYHFVGFDILDASGGVDGGHQVAFCRHGGALYFFDPNYGLYAVDDAALLLAAVKHEYSAGSFYSTHD